MNLTPSETLDDFLTRLGHPPESLGGHCREIHARFFEKLLQENGWIKRILEVGFNAGHSAQMLLSASGADAQMVSFDIMQHAYSHLGKLYIDEHFAGRHLLIAGHSNQSVPAYLAQHTDKFDFIFIDGGHGVKTAYQDIVNLKQAAHENTLVMIDNVAPHRAIGLKVYKAWRQALEEGHLIHLGHHETEDYVDGWVMARYSFDGQQTADNPLPNYTYIERRQEKI